MEILYLIIFFLLGSIMGSFYHVLANRLSKEQSIIYPPSHCEKCNHQLKWFELIPIISYIIQGGKCRQCKTKISISYLLMEICTGILFAVCYHAFDLSLELISALLFVSCLIIIIISDIEYMIILDEVLIVSIFGIIIVDIFDVGVYETSLRILSGLGAFATMFIIKKIATFIAFPIALFLLISKKDNIIPFGPFLSMSAILLYIWGLTFTDIINFIIN